MSETTLTKYGPRPSKIGERNIYDLRVLDYWMDGLASLPIGAGGAAPADPEAELLKAIYEAHPAVRHPARRAQR